MSIIEKNRNILTLINVFTVAPDKQQELVTLLIDATQQTMRRLPGFISANIHRSLDGKKVVNYAQWESMLTLKRCGKTQRPCLTCRPLRHWHSSIRFSARSLTL